MKVFACTTFLAIIFLAGTIHAQAQQSDFSGTWVRNTSKCDAGQLSVNSIPVRVIVKQKGTGIEITRISINRSGDTLMYTEKLVTDGSSSTTVVKANLNKKSSVKSSPDQKGWTETSDYSDDNGNPVQKLTESWTLTEDGRVLTIKSTLDTDGKVYEMTEVYDLG